MYELKKTIIVFFCFIICGLIFAQSPYTLSIDLDKAVFFSLANNSQLKLAKANLKINDKAFYYDLRKFLPSLAFGYSENDAVNLNATDSHSRELSMGISMLIFDGGKLIFDAVGKKVQLEFSKKSMLNETNKIITETRNKYYSLLLLNEKEKLQAALLKSGEIQENHAQLELKAGSMSEIDYYDILLKNKKIQIDYEKTKREKSNSLTEFKYYIGLDQTEIELDDKIEYEFLDLTSDMINLLQNNALAKRLDLAQNKFSVFQSKLNYWYTILSFIPEVNAGINLNLKGTEFPPREKSWGVTFEIKVPLAFLPVSLSPSLNGNSSNTERGKGNSTNTKVAEGITYENDIAKAQTALAEQGLKYEDLVRQINLAVKMSVEDYIENYKIYKLKLLENVFSARKIEIMRLKLKLGEIKRVDLLEEEIKHNERLIEERNMLFNLINMETKIQDAIGIINVPLKDFISQIRLIKEMK